MHYRPLLITIALTTTLALSTHVFAQDMSAAGRDKLTGQDPVIAELYERADFVLESIARLRGVAATGPVARDVQSREALRDRLAEMVATEIPADRLEAEERVMRRLRIIDENTGYVDLMLDLLEDQIAGFYDDSEQVLYLLDDGPPEMQETVMAHELFHAIQDQVWTLDAIRGRSGHISDVSLARTALVEGDAVAVMLDHTTGDAIAVQDIPMLDSLLEQSVAGPDAVEGIDVPLLLWEQLVYPYTAGLSFVLSVLGDEDWSVVDAVYLDPPDSTEQVLHPERYVNRDEPTWLDFDISGDALGTASPGESYYLDVFGEFSTRSLFRQMLSPSVAPAAIDRATEGWDGDRFMAYRTDAADRDLLVWASVWDSMDDARQFAAVAARLAQPYVGTDAEKVGDTDIAELYTAHSDSAGIYIERWGDLAVVVLDTGGPATALERETTLHETAERVWSTLTRSRYPNLDAVAE